MGSSGPSGIEPKLPRQTEVTWLQQGASVDADRTQLQWSKTTLGHEAQTVMRAITLMTTVAFVSTVFVR